MREKTKSGNTKGAGTEIERGVDCKIYVGGINEGRVEFWKKDGRRALGMGYVGSSLMRPRAWPTL